MEHAPRIDRWKGGDPVLMTADENADLCQRKNWLFSEVCSYDKIGPEFAAYAPGGEASYAWLESNIVLERDKTSEFYGEFLVFLRTNRCLFPNTGIVIKAQQRADGTPELLPKQKLRQRRKLG